jgi:alginate O-acetyltransferase complex protein AlgI
MLFNSYAFILCFLPITLAGFFIFGRMGKLWGASWLAGCSLLFYGWWDYRYLPLLFASISINYLLGGYIARHAQASKGRRALVAAVIVNLALLGYYKYADFFLRSANGILGTEWPLLNIILPIGISFYTFTQIAFLVDAYAGKVAEYRFVNYLLFVTYFPHLIAGPVLHHKEMMPQFDDTKKYRLNISDIAIGSTIFAIGLAKKVLIADNLSEYVAHVFENKTESPTLLFAWGGALAYAFQLYFDFSGYSDMAIGIARLFGIRLPLNFDSPYKAANIIEFWRRWHMTLSRFLRDYLYIPLGGNRHGAFRRNINLFATMVLGGLWHGAGWNFVIWGALHGVFLIANNMWIILLRKCSINISGSFSRGLGVSLTFVCVVFGWVYFRASDLQTANRIVIGMLGINGVAIPEAVASRMGHLWSFLQEWGVSSFLGLGGVFVGMWCSILLSGCVAFLFPNTQEIMHRFEPAYVDEGSRIENHPARISWRPRKREAVLVGILFSFGLLALSRPTEFLYFQF